MITGGLSWWQSWIWYAPVYSTFRSQCPIFNICHSSVWLGYFIAGSFIVSTGRIGAVYHIGFPVVARSSFGIWGSLWPVFNRAAMACIWYGVQSWLGGAFNSKTIGDFRINNHCCRYLRLPDDSKYMAKLRERTKWYPGVRNKHSRFRCLLPFLAPQFASHLGT